MHSTSAAAMPLPPEAFARPAVGSTRMLIGLLQGLLIFVLDFARDNYSWPATEPLLYAPLLAIAVLVPALAISGMGHLARRQLLIWAGTAAVIVGALACYDVWRNIGAPMPQYPQDARPRAPRPSELLAVFLVAGFFIAHSLVMAAHKEGRRIASYAGHFEMAWKLVIQGAFSVAFIGAVWAMLFLGSQLFMLVKLTFLRDVIDESFFAIPVTTFAFACAIHLTDVRPAIVQGIRTLLLTLMSWVLPVMTFIVGAFVLSLPFTGLDSLWATRSATAVLLGTSAALVMLINAAWQDGSARAATAPVIRLSARGAALLLVPLVAIAVYALALRVGDYGWTTDRIIAAACLLLAGWYAIGYAAGAVRAGWLDTIPRVNMAAAFLILATLLALFSPLADPARLSVNDQTARLASGKTPADKFDFAYLKFEGKRYGRAALERIEAGASGKDAELIRARIAAVRKMRGPWEFDTVPDIAPNSYAANLKVWPEGARLPDSFFTGGWTTGQDAPQLPACLRHAGKTCDAFMLDVTNDGKQEVILVGTKGGEGTAVLGQDENGKWSRVGNLPYYVAGCESFRHNLMAGKIQSQAPKLQDLDIGGMRVTLRTALDADTPCPPNIKSGRSATPDPLQAPQ